MEKNPEYQRQANAWDFVQVVISRAYMKGVSAGAGCKSGDGAGRRQRTGAGQGRVSGVEKLPGSGVLRHLVLGVRTVDTINLHFLRNRLNLKRTLLKRE